MWERTKKNTCSAGEKITDKQLEMDIKKWTCANMREVLLHEDGEGGGAGRVEVRAERERIAEGNRQRRSRERKWETV